MSVTKFYVVSAQVFSPSVTDFTDTHQLTRIQICIALDCELWWIYSDLLDNLNNLTDQRTRLFENSACPMTRRAMSRSSCGPFWAIMLCAIFLLVFLSLKKKGKERIIWTITWNLIHILVGHNSSYDITATSKSIEISRSYYIEAGNIETADDCCL